MGGRDYCIRYDRVREEPGRQGVWRLAAAFAEIALRRRGPETLPDSTFLVLILLAVDLLTSLIYLALFDGLTIRDMELLAGNLALSFAFVFAVLRFFKLERRFRQTMSARLGVDIWITLVFILFALPGWMLDADPQSKFYQGLWIGLFLWSVFIGAWVLARSLSQPLIIGLMFEILLTLTSFSLGDLLTPATNATN
jgi:hypothetical protein